jgi:hypothetical protein
MPDTFDIDWYDARLLGAIDEFVAEVLTEAVEGMAADARDLEEPYAQTRDLVDKLGSDPAHETEGGQSATFRSDSDHSRPVNDGHHLANGAWWEGRHYMEQARDRRVPQFKQRFRDEGFEVE